MLRTLEFDIEITKEPCYKIKALVGIKYKGNNKYRIRAMDIKKRTMIYDKEIEYPCTNGNSRKSFAKLRDIALNAIEDKPLTAKREG